MDKWKLGSGSILEVIRRYRLATTVNIPHSLNTRPSGTNKWTTNP